MTPSALQKLLRSQSQSASKIFPHLRRPLDPSPPPSVLTHIPQISNPAHAVSSPDHPRTDSFKPKNHSFGAQVYPSFSFGFFLNPNISVPLFESEPNDEASPDDSNVIRADSVKKKRKKKMNKHKLRKLRKRLRKKT